MASGYALPTVGGYHGHSHSYSNIHLSPGKTAPKNLPNGNGSYIKKAVSHSSLYTHAETSRETSPIPTPVSEHLEQQNHFPSFELNANAFSDNAALPHHHNTPSNAQMKSRPRGESDLSRPAAYRTSAAASGPSVPWTSFSETLTSLLVPLPYVVASIAYSSTSGYTGDFPPLAAYDQSKTSALENTARASPAGLIESFVFTSGTLLVIAILAKMQRAEQAMDRRKLSVTTFDFSSPVSISSLQSMGARILSVWLPFFAALQLGGSRTGLIILLAIATGTYTTE